MTPSLPTAALIALLWIAFTAGGHAQAMSLLEQKEGDVTASAMTDGKLREVKASIEIHASPEEIWRVLTNCNDAMKFVPGLVKCTITQKAADDSWQRVRHVLRYSWFVPRLSYEFRADMKRPSRVDFERTSGDLDSFKGSWNLLRDGNSTRVTYEAQSQLGFWVPQWLVRIAFKRDLPKMMRKLRELSELKSL